MRPHVLSSLLLIALSANARADGKGIAPTIDPDTAPTASATAPPFAVREDANVSGAWFRKVKTARSKLLTGIRTVVRLPQVTLDPDRWHRDLVEGEDSSMIGPLDRPSVYLGGNGSGHEVDCGLTWDRVYLGDGTSTEEFAFRPFWRAEGKWRNPKVKDADRGDGPPNVYFRPGETLALSVECTAPDKLRMTLAGVDDPKKVVVVNFDVPGFGRAQGWQEWKRVHSVDQFREVDGRRVGNEPRPGKPTRVIPTRARLTGGRWLSVEILTKTGPVPLTAKTGTAIRGNDTGAVYASAFPGSGFTVSGGEDIEVRPTAP